MLGEIFGPMEMVQEGVQSLIDEARSTTDHTTTSILVARNTMYRDHIVVAVTLALHLTSRSDKPFTMEHVLDALTFLDRLDTLNLKVVGK